MSDLASKIQPPRTLRIPLRADGSEFTLVILHEGQARSAAERLKELIGFYADGQGGWIAAAQIQSGQWGYLNARAEWLMPPTFDNARGFSDDGFARFNMGGRWGYVNLAGQTVIAPQFADANAMCNGLAGVRTGTNQWRIIDASGRFTCEAKFFKLMGFAENGLACAVGYNTTRQKRFGFVDKSGEWKIEPRFHRPAGFGKHNVAAATDDDKKYGVIDMRGEWVLKPTYACINHFNADGFAYYYLENSYDWDNPPGYLNLRGEPAVRGDKHLSEHMVCGIAMNSHDGRAYIRSDNTELPTPPIYYGTQFRKAGRLALGLLSTRTSEAAAEPDRTRWGLLHDDGNFVRAPAELLEPLTDDENWIAYSNAEAETPLVPFLASKENELAWVDRDAVIQVRARYEAGRVSLLDAADQMLWQSAESDGECTAPQAYFERTETDFLQRMSSLDDVVPVAEKLLAQSEAQLHLLANGAAEDGSSGDEEVEVDEDEDEDDDDDGDEDDAALRATTIKCRVFRAYLDEQHYGHYEFLNDELGALSIKAYRELFKRLSAQFGLADPDPEQATAHIYSSDDLLAWAVPLKQALPGDDGALKEYRQLWLSLYTVNGSGDGDVWHEIWLRAAPSLDAFLLAQGSDETDADESHDDAEPDDQSDDADANDADDVDASGMPTTRAGWIAAVHDDASNIAAVPRQWIDDELLDYALEQDPELIEWAPGPLQTPERIEALIRRGAEEASQLPAQCMTADALALARSLYAGTPDWDYADQRKSVLPDRWDQNVFSGVWGALFDEQKVIRALHAGARWRDVPHWLRTDAVENIALDADIYNIQFIDKERITPELAARAVRHDYGTLIEYLPEALLTPELCKVSAQVNGLSLAHIPKRLRSVDVCVAALEDRPDVFTHVPDALEIEVVTRLIDADLAEACKDGESRDGSRWHGHRAWSNLWAGHYEAAIADARLAIDHVRYPQHPHYVLARAYRALGQDAEARLEASTVLSISSHYTAEWNEDEDTSWLKRFKRASVADDVGNMDEAALLKQLRNHPQTLSEVPRAMMTNAMVDAAVEADVDAVRFVPRRLMTPELYAIALKRSEKQFSQIPPDMMSEAACVELVKDSGWKLEKVPEQWRTRPVCVAAVLDRSSAMEHVPQALRKEVTADVSRLGGQSAGDGESEASGEARSALSDKFIDSLMREHRGEELGLRDKAVRGAWAVGVMVSGKSDEPATLTGFSGWLQQRPGLMLMLNGGVSLIALILHLIVTVAAWRIDGVWIGLATGVLFGFSEVYWAWKSFFTEPHNVWLGICCVLTLLYFVWQQIYKRVAKEFAKTHGDAEN